MNIYWREIANLVLGQLGGHAVLHAADLTERDRDGLVAPEVSLLEQDMTGAVVRHTDDPALDSADVLIK